MNVRIFLRLAAVLMTLSAMGCGTGETASSAGTAGSGGGGDGGSTGAAGSGGSGGSGGGSMCPDDPADGPVAEACGIWASASMGDDANEGTQAKPVKSLTRAIELAADGPGRVYACAETWTEPIIVPSHISMHGGFDCAMGWAYVAKKLPGGDKNAILTAGPDEIPMTWIRSPKGHEPLMTNFYVGSANATIPSGSSIAIFVRDEMSLTIRRCEVVAGDAVDGLDGAPGGAMPAPSGKPGNKGADACSAAVSKGGAKQENMCLSGTSAGGAGGDASDVIAADGFGGEPQGIGPGGMPGLGEKNAPTCTNGATGSDGADAAFGIGADAFGHLTLTGYIGNTGEDGPPGKVGQGGGGGGGTLGKAGVCGAATPGGAAGGSGAAGGCGGKGGSGGKPGGSSIAVAVRSDIEAVSFDMLILRAGKGGFGGKGGAPQEGGDGGDPGLGGSGSGSINPGCAGGKGGHGGKGGWGGGGEGGLSVCAATVSDHSPATVSVPMHCYPGLPGDGGIGVPFSSTGDGKGWPGVGTYIYQVKF